MKMLLTLIGSLIVSAQAFAVTNAKAVEIAAHRVDRLVALGKIDASFSKKIEKLSVAIVNQPPVHFKVRVSQTKPAQGTPMQVDLSFDKDGKPLAFQPVAGGVAGPDSGWTTKDAVALTENALHYVIDNGKDVKYSPYDKGLTTFVLSKGTLNGQTVAMGQLTSSMTKEKLNVYLKLDGSFISAEVVP